MHLKDFASTVLAEDAAFDNDDTSGSVATASLLLVPMRKMLCWI